MSVNGRQERFSRNITSLTALQVSTGVIGLYK